MQGNICLYHFNWQLKVTANVFGFILFEVGHIINKTVVSVKKWKYIYIEREKKRKKKRIIPFGSGIQNFNS